MGLDCSHDAFRGTCASFNRFRKSIVKAMGGVCEPTEDLLDERWYWGFGYGPDTHPGLHVFLAHSDCDGELSPQECAQIADELEVLLPKLVDPTVAQKFIAGCRLAASNGEAMEFD